MSLPGPRTEAGVHAHALGLLSAVGGVVLGADAAEDELAVLVQRQHVRVVVDAVGPGRGSGRRHGDRVEAATRDATQWRPTGGRARPPVTRFYTLGLARLNWR